MDFSIPVIELASSRTNLLEQVKNACKFGFFRVVNHGTPPDLLERVLALTTAFFALPCAYKSSCNTEKGRDGLAYFGQLREDWLEILKLVVSPDPESLVARDRCPILPSGYKEALTDYVSHQERLARTLMGLVSESLGLGSDYIVKKCAGPDPRVVLIMNHVPPCYDPESHVGIHEHSDPGTITIVQQDSIPGLQVLKDDKWMDVEPMKGAFLVNVGDHLQMLSNDKYTSCVHRVSPNSTKRRTSIAFFYSPGLEAMVQPASELVDDRHPPAYRQFKYGDFLAHTKQIGPSRRKEAKSRFESRNEK